jgi:hypothetical protein
VADLSYIRDIFNALDEVSDLSNEAKGKRRKGNKRVRFD